MEGTITEDDQENNSAMLNETDSERSFGDDLLETRSESDVPIRPPRPSKYGVKLFKNLSMDELGNSCFVLCCQLSIMPSISESKWLS